MRLVVATLMLPSLMFHVVHPDLKRAQLQRAEAAIVYQLDVDVRSRWGTPVVQFGGSGIPVYFVRARDWDRTAPAACRSDGGCHWFQGASSKPAIWIEDDSWVDTETVRLSHEIVEVAEDPDDFSHQEICDPVELDVYPTGNGVMLSDFVYPGWFRKGSAGPWDFMHATSRAMDASGDGDF